MRLPFRSSPMQSPDVASTITSSLLLCLCHLHYCCCRTMPTAHYLAPPPFYIRHTSRHYLPLFCLVADYPLWPRIPSLASSRRLVTIFLSLVLVCDLLPSLHRCTNFFVCGFGCGVCRYDNMD